MDATTNWQIALRDWLQQHPKIMPAQLQQLREEFVVYFPVNRLKNLTLEQYAVGRPDSFCYWLEFKTKELGSIKGGSASKFGVYWSKSEQGWRWNGIYQSAEDALAQITQGLHAQIEAANSGRFDELDTIGRALLGPGRNCLRGKPLYIYFPDLFLPISSPDHLRHFLNQFMQHPQGDLITLNRQLLAHMRSLSQFKDFDTVQMMAFLYDAFPPRKLDAITDIAQPDSTIPVINNRTKVFISYSHKDKRYLDRLRTHLQGSMTDQPGTTMDKIVDWWDDTMIRPGAKWQDEIRKAIASAQTAILLISADYLASRFIRESELPPLLQDAEADGLTILPVILSPCSFNHHSILSKFQAFNPPSKPLAKMSGYEKEDLWNRVVEEIRNPIQAS